MIKTQSNDKIERLSSEEERGSSFGNGRITKATSFIYGTSNEEQRNSGEKLSEENKIGTASEQENKLKSWAKANDKIIIKSFLKDKPYLDKGEEARVYKSDYYVYKTVNYKKAHKTPLEYLDRLAVQNYLFPGQSYELIGITNSKNMEFVVKQPYVNFFDKATANQVHEEMVKRGFEFMPATHYDLKSKFITDDYIIEDLHMNNVVIDSIGNYAFIDPIIKLNKKEYGFGGNRDSNGSIIKI